MKRLLVFPCLFAAGVAYGYWTGFLWPVATTVIRPFLRPEPCNEADWVG